MIKEDQFNLFKQQYKPKEEYSLLIYIKDDEFKCYVFKKVEIKSKKNNETNIAETYERRFKNKE